MNDDAYRLTSHSGSRSETYTYDLLGNRTSQHDIEGAWQYNDLNELLGYAEVSYEYDDNGNLTHVKVADQVVWTYTYDAANRMVHAEDGTGLIQADYGYDPFGRRLWKTVDNITTYFLYADEGLLAEFSSDGTTRIYGYLPGTSTPLFLRQNDTYYWHRTDRLGIPHTLMESNGTVVWSGAYDAFGNCEVGVETLENHLRLPGQYYDAETGLSYNLNRYYDPKTGRYLQPDPAGDGLNPYPYVGGNPVNAIDPLGLCALRMVGGVADIAAGLAFTGVTNGWSSVVAWAMIVNGVDNLVAGAYSLIGGEEIPTLAEQGLRSVMPRTAADLTYMGLQLGLGYAGWRVEKTARQLTNRLHEVLPEEDFLCLQNCFREARGEISPEFLKSHTVWEGGALRKISFTGGATRLRGYVFTRLKYGKIRLKIDEVSLLNGDVLQLFDDIIPLKISPISIRFGEAVDMEPGVFRHFLSQY